MKRAGLLIVSMTIMLSCNSQKKQTSPEVTSEPTVYQGVTDQNCAVEVNFGSYGSGIDPEALDKVVKAIESRGLKSTTTGIGREGERRICLPLTELKKREKNELIEELKKIAKEGQLVSVSIR